MDTLYEIVIILAGLWLIYKLDRSVNERAVKDIQARKAAINADSSADIFETGTDNGATHLTGTFINGRLHKVIVQRKTVRAAEYSVYYYECKRKTKKLLFVERAFTDLKTREKLYVYREWCKTASRPYAWESEGEYENVVPFDTRTQEEQNAPYYDYLREAYAERDPLNDVR